MNGVLLHYCNDCFDKFSRLAAGDMDSIWYVMSEYTTDVHVSAVNGFRPNFGEFIMLCKVFVNLRMILFRLLANRIWPR